MSVERYVHLAEFLASWFHQDFDLNGGTVAEVIASYQTVTLVDEQTLLRSDINQFLTEHADDTVQAFDSLFLPEIRVSALSGSAEAFLRETADTLGAA